MTSPMETIKYSRGKSSLRDYSLISFMLNMTYYKCSLPLYFGINKNIYKESLKVHLYNKSYYARFCYSKNNSKISVA